MSISPERAFLNFEHHLERNRYPGRGLLVGRDASGDWLQLYWLMGRSAGSRNRILESEGAVLRTAPRDPQAQVGDAALTLYEAMLELPGVYLVGNGAQVRHIADALAAGGAYISALSECEREPDAPNYTPRISAMLDFRSGLPELTLSILKAGAFDSAQSDRFHYQPAPPPPGFGLALTTYEGDGDPLPAFCGEPLLLPLDGPPEALAARYFEALDSEYRVALALKRIPREGMGPGELQVLGARDA